MNRRALMPPSSAQTLNVPNVHGNPRALLLRASVPTVGLGAFIAKQDVSVAKTSHMD